MSKYFVPNITDYEKSTVAVILGTRPLFGSFAILLTFCYLLPV